MNEAEHWFVTAKQIATRLLPTCELCSSSNAIPIPCKVCGKYVCLDHAFIKKCLVLLCDECMNRALASLTDKEGHPWDVLGVTPPCSEADVQKAFRQISMVLHPDRMSSGNPTAKHQAERLWTIVQRAREEALNIIRRMDS